MELISAGKSDVIAEEKEKETVTRAEDRRNISREARLWFYNFWSTAVHLG